MTVPSDGSGIDTGGGEGEAPPAVPVAEGREFVISSGGFDQAAAQMLADWQGAGFTVNEGGFSQSDSAQIRIPAPGWYTASVDAAAVPAGGGTASSVRCGVVLNGAVQGEERDAVWDGSRWVVSLTVDVEAAAGDLMGVQVTKDDTAPTLTWTCSLSVVGAENETGS